MLPNLGSSSILCFSRVLCGELFSQVEHTHEIGSLYMVGALLLTW